MKKMNIRFIPVFNSIFGVPIVPRAVFFVGRSVFLKKLFLRLSILTGESQPKESFVETCFTCFFKVFFLLFSCSITSHCLLQSLSHFFVISTPKLIWCTHTLFLQLNKLSRVFFLYFVHSIFHSPFRVAMIYLFWVLTYVLFLQKEKKNIERNMFI